ncbi:MAG: tetratricopeptide repeat protein [Actinomycetota bacterium]
MEAVSATTASLDAAASCMQDGKLDEALSILRAYVQRSPSDGHGHALIGICLAQQGNLDGSVKSLETAALLNPHDEAVEYNLANALFQVGRHDQAKWRLTRIIEDNPEHQDAKLLLTHIQRLTAAAGAPPKPALAQTQAIATGAGGYGARQAACLGAATSHFAPELTGAPSVGLRLLRGVGWGLAYSLWWTGFSLIGAFILSLFTTKVEHAVLAFLVMCVLSTLFHSAMGMLTGVVTALLNADEDAGAWVGACVGFFILLVGLVFGFLAMWAVVFYIFMGRFIGRSIAVRVQRPVAG